MTKEKNIKIPSGKELIDARSLLEQMDIKERMKVADLGCGRRAYFSLQAAKLIGPQGLVYAVDVVKNVLENVKSMANLFGVQNIITIWADLEVAGGTKIPEQSIDLAILNNILFQTKKDELIIKEASRILKNGGKLLVVDWKKTSTPFGPSLEDRSDPNEIKTLANKYQMAIDQEFEAGHYHYGLIFIKK